MSFFAGVMAAVIHEGSKYSWWDSYIYPKNSKCFHENLTDMDAKVKQTEEDADYFARRAEMYYKKRPELMKLVEEFYRAYHPLAVNRRHDSITVEVRSTGLDPQGFGSSVKQLQDEKSKLKETCEAHQNERAGLLEKLEIMDKLLEKNAVLENSLSDLNVESENVRGKVNALEETCQFLLGKKSTLVSEKASLFSQLQATTEKLERLLEKNNLLENSLFDVNAELEGLRVKSKSLEDSCQLLGHDKSNLISEKETLVSQLNISHGTLENLEKQHGELELKHLERINEAETEILALKKALAELEGEKEVEVQKVKAENNILNELKLSSSLSIKNLQDEILSLRETIGKLEQEAELRVDERNGFQQEIYCLKEEINAVNRRHDSIMVEVRSTGLDPQGFGSSVKQLQDEKSKLKEACEAHQNERAGLLEKLEIMDKLLEKNAVLENSLSDLNVESENVRGKVNALEETCQFLLGEKSTLVSEKASLFSQLQHTTEKLERLLEKNNLLENSLFDVNAELEGLRVKSKSLEDSCQLLGHDKSNLISEKETLVSQLNISHGTLENLEKQHSELELKHLEWMNKAETEILALKKALAELEGEKEDEVQKVKAENNILNELKLSSSLSIKNLQDEILSLRETIGKLEQEAELRVDERNGLQQEIYCLKEEINAVNRRHDSIMVEVRSTGLDPKGFGSSVKQLQDEKLKLKETCEAHQNERAGLLEKLEIMDKLLEKNAVLENSLSDLNVELENVRGKVKALEETCQFLLGEKSTLVSEKATLFSQLQATTEKLERLLEKNNLLENSLFDVNAELEGLRMKSKSLEDSCQLLGHDKSNLISEKETLVSQLNISHGTLENLEKQHSELELKHLELKGEKESALQKVEELLVSLYAEREEQSRIAQLSERHLADKESQIYLLQEDANCWRKEYEEELDRAMHAQLEIFTLLKCIEDLEDKNFYLLIEYQRLLEASKISERLISKFENENRQKQMDMDSLSERLRILRTRLLQVLMTLDIDGEHPCEDMIEQDQMLLNIVYRRLQETHNSLVTIFNESQHLTIENSIFVAFLEQLKLKGENLVTERGALGDEFRIQSEQFLALQVEFQKILNENQELKLTISEEVQRMEVMATEVGNLYNQLPDLELAQKDLQEECCKTIEEKRFLMTRFQDLCEVKSNLEEEIRVMVDETIAQSTISLFYQNIVSENFLALKEQDLCEVKSNLEEEIRVMVDETIAQSTISLFYQNIVSENFLALKELSEDFDELGAVNNDLEERLKALVEKLEDTQMENTHLKETLVMSNIELKLVESVNGQLDCQIKKGNEMLLQKGNKILEAEELSNAVQTEKTELQMMMKDLKSKYDEARVTIEDQAIQILKLSSDKDCRHKELECLCGVNKKLQFEMSLLHEELGETKLREENLSYQLHEGANEIELLESQAGKLYAQLLVSAVNETLFEGKVQELTQACESLERGSISKGIESEQLKERVVKLEGDKGRLRNELPAHVSAVSALKDSITSLEMQTFYHTERNEYKESQDSGHYSTFSGLLMVYSLAFGLIIW